jgi:hypothetical protein
MKNWLVATVFFVAGCGSNKKETTGNGQAENLIVITLDGLRWQEVFKGMDSAIANTKKFNEGDSAYLFEKYWAGDENERRKKLLPFLWSAIQSNGQIYGNRAYGNRVDNANPYWFSYPGYNEIFTGYPDTAINSNSYPPNPHVTVLEFLNNQPALKGRVAAFGAWDAFDRILNEERSGIPVYSGFDSLSWKNPTTSERLIHEMMLDSYKPWHSDECLDVFTHYIAVEYLKSKKPKVLYIAYGETDEWAHAGKYRSYLDAANQVDVWLKKIWEFVQINNSYKNKTTLFITVDHGRGDKVKEKWTSHNNTVEDSHEMWFAVMGPGIKNTGEIKEAMQLYQKQFAQTLAKILGYTYIADHPIAEEITEIFKK